MTDTEDALISRGTTIVGSAIRADWRAPEGYSTGSYSATHTNARPPCASPGHRPGVSIQDYRAKFKPGPVDSYRRRVIRSGDLSMALLLLEQWDQHG